MRRKKVSEGDLFELPAPDGRKGYGQIVISGDLLYVVIFEGLFEQGPPSCEDFAKKILLIGWTTDALIYHDRWKMVGTCPDLRNIPFPNYKVKIENDIFVTDFDGKPIRKATPVETDLLDFRGGYSPAVFQDCLFAHHGLANSQALADLSIKRAEARCIIRR